MAVAALVVSFLLLTQQPDPLQQASAHLDAGRAKEAIPLLTSVLAKDPKNVPAQFQIAIAYGLTGNDAESAAAFRKVLELEPTLYQAQINLGQLLIKTGKPDEAVGILTKAAEQKPKEAKPQYLLGQAYLAQKKLDEAAAAMAVCAELDPANAELPLELAGLYEQTGKKQEAAALYRKFPDNPGARERLGLILFDAGDFAGSAEQLEAAVAKKPTVASRYLLATVYLRLKQPEKSIPQAQAILEQEPQNFDVRMLLGRLLRDQKKYPDAAEQFQAAVKLKPDSGEAWNEFTAMLILLQRFDIALQALEKSRALNGDTPAYYYFRATMLDALKQPVPALESYRKFLEVSNGLSPDEEFKARQRVRILERVTKK